MFTSFITKLNKKYVSIHLSFSAWEFDWTFYSCHSFQNLQFQLSKFVLRFFHHILPFEFHKSSWKSVTHESYCAISKSTPCSFSILIQIVKQKTNRKPLRIWQLKRIKICFSFSFQSDSCCLKWENGFGVFNRFVISPDASKAWNKRFMGAFFCVQRSSICEVKL